MAYDSVAITPGSGVNVAAVTVGGRKLQAMVIGSPTVDGQAAEVSVAEPAYTDPAQNVRRSPRAYSVYRNVDLLETGSPATAGVNVKNSAGLVHGFIVSNTHASLGRYLKLYNKATTPTVGTDTPFMTIFLPSNSTREVEFDGGIPFSVGIGVGATTGAADNDTGQPGAYEVILNLLYK